MTYPEHDTSDTEPVPVISAKIDIDAVHGAADHFPGATKVIEAPTPKEHEGPFVWNAPETTPCPACGGAGSTSGTFGKPWVCVPCDGFGWLNAATGEALVKDERIAMLSADLQAALNVNKRLEQRLADLSEYQDMKLRADIAAAAYPNPDRAPRRGGHGD